METIKDGKKMTGQMILYDKKTKQVFVVRDNKVRMQQHMDPEEWERMKKKAKKDGATVQYEEEWIKMEELDRYMANEIQKIHEKIKKLEAVKADLIRLDNLLKKVKRHEQWRWGR